MGLGNLAISLWLIRIRWYRITASGKEHTNCNDDDNILNRTVHNGLQQITQQNIQLTAINENIALLQFNRKYCV